MISTRPMKYKLDFCYPNTYASFVRAIKTGGTVARVGFLGIETLRLFVSVFHGELHLEVYKKTDKSWEPYSKPLTLREPDVAKMCHSAQEYEEELVRVFFAAFPHAEESFYDNMPNHKEILAELEAAPTEDRVKELLLLYTVDDDTGIDDADGCICITCVDGLVYIPYDVRGTSRVLQMYRAKFHPDEPVSNAFNGFFDWVDSLVSRASSLTLNGVLHRIDNLVK